MKIHYLTFLTLFAVACGNSETSDETDTSESSTDTISDTTSTEVEAAVLNYEDALALIPAEYELFDSAFGHLNDDAYMDGVLVLKSIEEEDFGDSDRDRPIYIVSSNADGAWTVVEKNNNITLCQGCGGVFGDPFESVMIEVDKSFSVNHYGGSADRWTKNTTFSWNAAKGTWILTEDISLGYNTMDPENTETELNLQEENWGKVSFADYSSDW